MTEQQRSDRRLELAMKTNRTDAERLEILLLDIDPHSYYGRRGVISALKRAIKLIQKEDGETPEKKGIWIEETDCEGKTRTIRCPFCGWKSGQYQWKDEKFCAGCGKAMEVRDILSLRKSLS